MFRVIDICDSVYDCYGTFIDEYGDIQFILCDSDGNFFKTNEINNFYKLYKENID